MKNLSLFTLILIAILAPLIANGQKYVGTWYGSVPGASNAPPNIATNGATAANGTIMQKTGDRLQLTDTLTNLNIGTAVVSVVYGPYTNLAGYFNAEGRFVGTNSLAVTNTIIGGTNQYGSDGFQATKTGQMYFYQGASGIFNFGQSGIGSSDGHVIAGDFTGNGATAGTVAYFNGGKTLVSATSAQIGAQFSGGSTYLKADGTTGTGGGGPQVFTFNGNSVAAVTLNSSSQKYAPMLPNGNSAQSTLTDVTRSVIAIQAPFTITNFVYGYANSTAVPATTNLFLAVYTNTFGSGPGWTFPIPGNGTTTSVTNDTTFGVYIGGTAWTNTFTIGLSNGVSSAAVAFGPVWWSFQVVK